MSLFSTVLFIFILSGGVLADKGRVVELDSDSFAKVIASPGGALVKFYAPWCGYCQRFEGLYFEAAQALANVVPDLTIARIDGTRFPSEASFAHVRGYPTVILFKGEKSYSFNGDRTVDGVVSFVERVLGPPVEQLADLDALNRKSEEFYDAVFFLYRGLGTDNLWESYNTTAEGYRLQLPFYQLKVHSSDEVSEVYVYKDGGKRLLEPKEGVDLLQQVKDFVEQNKSPAFGHLNAYDLRHMPGDASTLICVFLVDYVSDFTAPFKAIGRELAFQNFNPFSNVHLKFVWSVDVQGMSSLAMTSMEAPNILLFSPANQTLMLHPLYSQPEAIANLKKQQISDFLSDVVSAKIPRYGGSGWATSIRRFCFDFFSACKNMIQTSPLIALMTFGVPLGCLSCLVYCICCASVENFDVPDEKLSAAAMEARRARMFDRKFLEEQVASASYEDITRARSIYSRRAGRTWPSELTTVEPESGPEESRKDR